MNSRYSKIPQLVQPTTDLGLKEIQNALTIKNAKIEQNYISVQSNLDKMSKLDVIKGVDKDYIQNQLNKTIDNLNQIGSQDLSDSRNIVTINTMVNGLLDDKNIKNALISTQNIRKVQQQWEQINTNPKLAHLKHSNSVVNEWSDNQEVNDYLKDNRLGLSFNKSSATIGVDTQKLFDTEAKSVQAQIIETVDPADPLKKILTKQRSQTEIQQAINNSLSNNPEALAQERRNFLYQYQSNPKKATEAANSLIDKHIKEFNGKAIEAGVQAQFYSGKDAKTEDYFKTIAKNNKEYADSLKGERLSVDNLDTSFRVLMRGIAEPYINQYGQVLERKKTLNTVAAKKADLLLKEKQSQMQEQKNNNDNAYKNSMLDLAKQKVDVDKFKVMSEVSPAYTKKFAKENGMPDLASFSEEMLATVEPATFSDITEDNVIDRFESTQLSLRDDNIKIASEIVGDALQKNDAIGSKMNELISKKQLQNFGGKTKWLFSNAGLTTLKSFVEGLEDSSGAVLNPDIVKVKDALDIIEKNNRSYFINEKTKESVFKKFAVKEDGRISQEFYPQDPLGFSMVSDKTKKNYIGNIVGAKKELMTHLSNATGYLQIPIASLNADADKKDVWTNLRQQFDMEAESNGQGYYSPMNPKVGYTKSGYIGGKKNNKEMSESIISNDKDKALVDWDKSIAYFNPGKNEVVQILKDSRGNIVKTDEFPDGKMVVKVSDNTINAIFPAIGSSQTKAAFTGINSKDFDKLLDLSDRDVTDMYKGRSISIPGIPSKYNLRMEISKANDKFTVKIPSANKVYVTTSLDNLTNQFSTYFNQQMKLLKEDPKFVALKTEQDRANFAVKTISERFLIQE